MTRKYTTPSVPELRTPSLTRNRSDISTFPPHATVQFQEKFSTLSTPEQLEKILLGSGFAGSQGVYRHPDVYLRRVDRSSNQPFGRTYFALEAYSPASKITKDHPLRRALRELCEATPIGIAPKEQVEAYLGIHRD